MTLTPESLTDEIKSLFGTVITVTDVSTGFPAIGTVRSEGHTPRTQFGPCRGYRVRTFHGQGDTERESLEDLRRSVLEHLHGADLGLLLIRQPAQYLPVWDPYRGKTYHNASMRFAIVSDQPDPAQVQ